MITIKYLYSIVADREYHRWRHIAYNYKICLTVTNILLNLFELGLCDRKEKLLSSFYSLTIWTQNGSPGQNQMHTI